MKIMRWMWRKEFGAAMRYKWKIMIHQQLHTRITRTGVGDDNTVGRAIFENVFDWFQRIAVAIIRDHIHVVTRALNSLANALNEKACKVDRLTCAFKHECNDIGLASAKAHARTVRNIPQLCCRLTHPFMGFLIEPVAT